MKWKGRGLKISAKTLNSIRAPRKQKQNKQLFSSDQHSLTDRRLKGHPCSICVCWMGVLLCDLKRQFLIRIRGPTLCSPPLLGDTCCVLCLVFLLLDQPPFRGPSALYLTLLDSSRRWGCRLVYHIYRSLSRVPGSWSGGGALLVTNYPLHPPCFLLSHGRWEETETQEVS